MKNGNETNREGTMSDRDRRHLAAIRKHAKANPALLQTEYARMLLVKEDKAKRCPTCCGIPNDRRIGERCYCG